MPATLNGLIAEVESNLSAHGKLKDRVSALTSPLAAGATVLTLNSVTDMGVGYLEITSVEGIETVAIASKDEQASTLTAHPWGRGERGTADIAHSAGSRVSMDPEFPRSQIKTAINETILSLYPAL